MGTSQHGPRLTVDGEELQAGVVNETEVRAAAGLTFVIGAVAFRFACFTHNYIPLQAVASYFVVDFLIRVTVGLRYSPAGIMARAMTRQNPPERVSAKPKRFASRLGLAMALAMAIIINGGIRGYPPITICLIFLTLMWMETALGLRLGCEIHGLLVRRGWARRIPTSRYARTAPVMFPRRPPRPAILAAARGDPRLPGR